MCQFLFKSQEDFHRCMLEIDENLAKENPKVPGREIRALRKLGKMFPDLKCVINKDNPVIQWYEAMYGERLKGIGPIISSTVLIRHTPYKVIFPMLVYGVVSVEPLTFLENITNLRLKTLRSEEASALANLIIELWKCIFRIDRINYSLWYGDLTVSVAMIMQNKPHYGISKWSALQMSEKVIKSYIESKGGDVPKGGRGHDLSMLLTIASKYGLNKPPEELISKIQCPAGVRYNEGNVSMSEAIDAQHAAIYFCDFIARERGLEARILIE